MNLQNLASTISKLTPTQANVLACLLVENSPAQAEKMYDFLYAQIVDAETCAQELAVDQ